MSYFRNQQIALLEMCVPSRNTGIDGVTWNKSKFYTFDL